MARIIGGIAASHTPTIGFAYDRNKRDDPVWAPIFENFAPLSAWLAEKRPDVLLWIYNDHVTSFFFDHYSAFALGVGPEWPVADEGGGARDLPPINGHPQLASHIGHSLMADEFDMSFFQHRALDHGCFSPLSVLCPHEPEWPVSLVPLQMGVLQFPIPSAAPLLQARTGAPARDRKLSGGSARRGRRHRRAVAPGARRARRLQQSRSGTSASSICSNAIRSSWPTMTIAEYAELGGFEGAEVVMWLTMRGALSANVECKHRSYYLPSMTGIATAIYEGTDAPNPAVVERQRRHVASELSGVERLEGTYPFTLERSVKAFRINDYLHRMVEPSHREAFLRDPEASFDAARPDRRRARPDPSTRLARPDALRRHLLRAREAWRRHRRVEPAHLRRDARRNARSLPAHAQCSGRAVLGRGQRRRQPRWDQPAGNAKI